MPGFAVEPYKTLSRNTGQHHRGDMAVDPVRLAIADKNPLIIRGLRSLFTEDGRFETVVAATDGELFLDCVERMQFDIGIIGWDMPFCNAQGVLEALVDHENSPSIIIYTGNPGPDIAAQAMGLGAAGFCSKTQAPEDLMDMIMSVAGGQMVFPLSRGKRHDPMVSLTAREREILKALCDGKTNARLAKAFGVSPNTIKFHLRNLYEKLGVQTRAAAVAMLLSR